MEEKLCETFLLLCDPGGYASTSLTSRINNGMTTQHTTHTLTCRIVLEIAPTLDWHIVHFLFLFHVIVGISFEPSQVQKVIFRSSLTKYLSCRYIRAEGPTSTPTKTTATVFYLRKTIYYTLVLLLLCFLRFRLYAFLEAAALRSIVLRYNYAGVSIATRVFCFFSFCLFGDVVFSEYFFVLFPLSLYMVSTSYVLSFRVIVIFYLVTTGWIFDISLLCENSINQWINVRDDYYSRGVGQVICR